MGRPLPPIGRGAAVRRPVAAGLRAPRRRVARCSRGAWNAIARPFAARAVGSVFRSVLGSSIRCSPFGLRLCGPRWPRRTCRTCGSRCRCFAVGCGRSGHCGRRGLQGGLCLALGGLPLEHQGSAPGQFFGRGGAVLCGDLAGGLAVEVEAVRRVRERLQVGGARRVAREEQAERALGEDTRRARLDVGVDAQLDRLERHWRMRPDEECREQCSQARAAGGR